MSEVTPFDVTPWPGLRLVHEVTEGNRNTVWQGELKGDSVAVRTSRRSDESLAWELELLSFLAAHDFVVPAPIAAVDGSNSVDGVVVQRWLPGREPASIHDWKLVGAELMRLHLLTSDYPRQRPDCCTVGELGIARRSVDADLDALPPTVQAHVLDVFADFDDVATSVIHGDLNPANVRIVGSRVGLLDWDESRIDLCWHDLSNLGARVLPAKEHRRAVRLSHAWEAANAWVVEPDYARTRLAKLAIPLDGEALE